VPTKEPSVLNPTKNSVPVQDSLRLLAESNSLLASAAPQVSPQQEPAPSIQPVPSTATRQDSLLKRGWWGAAIGGTFLLGFLGVHWLQGAACLLLVGTVGAELKSGKRSGTDGKSARDMANEAIAWDRRLRSLEKE
jgi:hypothetical protein